MPSAVPRKYLVLIAAYGIQWNWKVSATGLDDMGGLQGRGLCVRHPSGEQSMNKGQENRILNKEEGSGFAQSPLGGVWEEQGQTRRQGQERVSLPLGSFLEAVKCQTGGLQSWKMGLGQMMGVGLDASLKSVGLISRAQRRGGSGSRSGGRLGKAGRRLPALGWGPGLQ